MTTNRSPKRAQNDNMDLDDGLAEGRSPQNAQHGAETVEARSPEAGDTHMQGFG